MNRSDFAICLFCAALFVCGCSPKGMRDVTGQPGTGYSPMLVGTVRVHVSSLSNDEQIATYMAAFDSVKSCTLDIEIDGSAYRYDLNDSPLIVAPMPATSALIRRVRCRSKNEYLEFKLRLLLSEPQRVEQGTSIYFGDIMIDWRMDGAHVQGDWAGAIFDLVQVIIDLISSGPKDGRIRMSVEDRMAKTISICQKSFENSFVDEVCGNLYPALLQVPEIYSEPEAGDKALVPDVPL